MSVRLSPSPDNDEVVLPKSEEYLPGSRRRTGDVQPMAMPTAVVYYKDFIHWTNRKYCKWFWKLVDIIKRLLQECSI